MASNRMAVFCQPFRGTVYPKKYAHGFCFAVLCCGYTLTDFPISIRLTSLALWQSNDCPSASKATLMNMDRYFMWIHCERLHNHNKAKHNKTVCIFLGIYCIVSWHGFILGRIPLYLRKYIRNNQLMKSASLTCNKCHHMLIYQIGFANSACIMQYLYSYKLVIILNWCSLVVYKFTRPTEFA